MTALQNANKENLDSLDISSLIQFEEPWSTVFTLLSVTVIQIRYEKWHPVHAVNRELNVFLLTDTYLTFADGT